MKASPSTLALLATAIEPLDTAERRAHYRTNVVAVRSIDRRYRHDLLWSVMGSAVPWSALDGLSDAHIDTALRSIVAPLNG